MTAVLPPRSTVAPSPAPQREPAEAPVGRTGRLRRRLSLRVRITAAALVVVAIVLTLGSISLVQVLQHALLRQVDSSLAADAEGVARVVRAGNAPRNGLPERYVQFSTVDGTILGTNDIAESLPLLNGRHDVPNPRNTVRFTRTDPRLGRIRVLVKPFGTGGNVVEIIAQPINQLTDTTRSLATLLWFGVPVLTLALGFAVWRMVGHALRPVEEVRAAVSDITARDLSDRVASPGTGDEIDRLTQTVNEMLDRLESSVQGEQRFVADASHELRSPIAGMRALLESQSGAGIVTADRAAVLAALSRLQDLADQLLALASPQGGAPPARTRAVDLDELVLSHAVLLRASARGVSIDTSAVSGGQVAGDPGELARLVDNLGSNAVRHARSVVRFSVHELADRVELVVSDDGPGIPPADRARIFERFTRLDDARSRDVGGAGLGLAIVARIVERHGGSIVVDDAPGGGARFVVDLPGSVSLGRP